MQLGKRSPASRLRVKPFYKHKGESESKNCAAERSKMGLGGESLADISTGNISARRRRASLAKTILKGIRSECDCPFIAAQLFCVISGDMFTNDVSKRQSKKKKRITHETWWKWFARRVKLCDEQDACFSWLTDWLDGAPIANHNRDQWTRPPHQHHCCQHWTRHGERKGVLYYRRERPARTVNVRTDTRVIRMRPGSGG